VRWAANRYVPRWQGVGFPWGIVAASAVTGIVVFALDRWLAPSGLWGLAALVAAGGLACLLAYLSLGVMPLGVVTGTLADILGRWSRHAEP
jgi:hypothetical protein